MEITEEQYQQVAHLFPVPRGSVNLSNLQVLNAVLYLAEQGCKKSGRCRSIGMFWHWTVPVSKGIRTLPGRRKKGAASLRQIPRRAEHQSPWAGR